MTKTLHIVAFDVPYPADYGGVIDVWGRVKALSEAGIHIHLHCYTKGRSPVEILSQYCQSVHYYPRKTGVSGFSFRYPYMANSRHDAQLLNNLSQDHHPILLEGLQCCRGLQTLRTQFPHRKIGVRMHNVEQDYYLQLAKVEKQLWKRIYYKWESRMLQRFESVLSYAEVIFAISPADTAYFQSRYSSVKYLPAAHDFSFQYSEGLGKFALYHGNLAVAENHQAALFLIQEVFSTLSFPLIIAGNAPQAALIAAAAQFSHISIVSNPTYAHMQCLLADAQMHVLPTFQATGIKLKLLASLTVGRHVIVNPPMIDNTGLAHVCTLAEDAQAFREQIMALQVEPFALADFHARKKVFAAVFSPEIQVKTIAEGLLSE